MLFWLAGDLGGGEAGVASLAPLMVLGVVLLGTQPLARELNVLLRGTAAAIVAGRAGASAAAHRSARSLATAVAVTTGGAIGFVGLVVPHACGWLWQRPARAAAGLRAGRRHAAAAHRHDRAHAARAAAAAGGVITALLGVPTFIALLLLGRGAAMTAAARRERPAGGGRNAHR